MALAKQGGIGGFQQSVVPLWVVLTAESRNSRYRGIVGGIQGSLEFGNSHAHASL